MSLRKGLLLEWKMEQLPVVDGTPRKQNPSSSGCTIVSGKVGSALSVDGVDDSFSVGSVEFTKPMKTISFWVKTTDSGSSWQSLVSWTTNNDGGNQSTRSELGGNAERIYTRWICDPKSDADSTSDGGCWSRSGSYNYNDGNWHFYASTFDGDVIKEYWDGEVFTSSSGYNSSVASTVKNGGLAVNANSIPFEIDELRIYSRAITEDEARELYNVSADRHRIV